MRNLIGLLLYLTAIAVPGNGHHSSLTLSPSDATLVRYTNESLIVQCSSVKNNLNLHWKSPNGDLIKKNKGRIHIENNSSTGQLTIVFTHISLADKGNWTCEDTESGTHNITFDLIVYQKIIFTENATVQAVKEGKNATILCEVKGEPQPTITWSFNGQPITIDTNSSKLRILADGLLINKVAQNDTGEYTCRAYQVNSIASDMQERTVLLKIEHKPVWIHSHHTSVQYAYINGTATMLCEAIAEPPANFTWFYLKKRIHNNEYFSIETNHVMSSLTIRARDASIMGVYKCRIQNELGFLERTITLKQSEKPPAPDGLHLRGYNSNTFDIVLGTPRTAMRSPLEVIAFRIEFQTGNEFRTNAGNWKNAKRRDFPFVNGATYPLNKLEPNTTYYMRAASMNLAGLSDWTKVEKFTTLSNELRGYGERTKSTNFLILYALCFVTFLFKNTFLKM
ncbi:neural cell adhesion molecule 2 [Teleopsis dalmanni]|uniref:neural cell adhesion molecule 2 n=1 Tax=Teleopsis dalmanni TaxID=139649 RepID=UPI0018CD622F|nr:neural cell adhesion molecule 2 [Teleopsis dalmanni]